MKVISKLNIFDFILFYKQKSIIETIHYFKTYLSIFLDNTIAITFIKCLKMIFKTLIVLSY